MSHFRNPRGDGPATVVNEELACPTPAPAAQRPSRTPWWETVFHPTPVDVTVCIANWNCREVLRACLASLYTQSQGVRLETIVVDNGSADGAADMVAAEFPQVALHRNAVNVGFARANNQAARLARGRYLFFLNNDTVVPPNTLKRLLAFAQSQPHVGMVGPLLRDGEGKVQSSYRLRPTIATFLHRTCLLRWTGLLKTGYERYRRQDGDLKTSRPVEVLMGAAMLLPREVFFECGGWDEEYHFGGEDLDLCYRVAQRYPLVFHPNVEITHFGRVSTRQHISFASTKIAVGFVQYLRKTGASPSALLLYKLMITVDAPLQWLIKSAQYLWRRLRARPEKAERSLVVMRGLQHFLFRGLVAFWRA
jgi:N-acetylglucosaminyl-diphospho-decaprenol L-rhamnosyltransferase